MGEGEDVGQVVEHQEAEEAKAEPGAAEPDGEEEGGKGEHVHDCVEREHLALHRQSAVRKGRVGGFRHLTESK